MPNAPVQAAAEGLPKFPGYQEAFQRLEVPIGRALQIAKVQNFVVDALTRPDGTLRLSTEEEHEVLTFICRETLDAIDAADTAFLDLHNASCEAGWAKIRGAK